MDNNKDKEQEKHLLNTNEVLMNSKGYFLVVVENDGGIHICQDHNNLSYTESYGLISFVRDKAFDIVQDMSNDDDVCDDCRRKMEEGDDE